MVQCARSVPLRGPGWFADLCRPEEWDLAVDGAISHRAERARPFGLSPGWGLALSERAFYARGVDLRNPEHPRTRFRQGNWRTWREENGVFYLERHETDPATGQHEDAWITIDPQRKLIEEKVGGCDRVLTVADKMQILRQVGLIQVGLKTMAGEDFEGGEEPYWLWLVAQR